MLEVAVQSETGRNIEVRKGIADFLQPHVAAFGDAQGASENVGRVFEDTQHFVVTLDKKIAALELHAIGILNRLAGLDAEHHVLGVGVVFAEVVTVVGRDQRQAEIFFQTEQIGVDAMFLLQALILNLKKEIVGTKNVAVGCSGIAGGIVIFFHQPLGHFAFQAARESDQTFGVFGEKLLAHPRLVVKPAQRGFGSDLGQVAVAFLAFRENQKMVVGITVGRSALDIVVVLLADVQLAANDGFDAGLVRGIDEMDRAKNVAVVGHGDRRHTHLFDALDKLFDVAGAVEHGVIGMEMQVDELGHELRCSYSNGKFVGGEWEFIHSGKLGASVLRTSLRTGRTADYLGIWKSTPRSSLALAVASRSIHDKGSLVARCSLKTQSVPPTMA